MGLIRIIERGALHWLEREALLIGTRSWRYDHPGMDLLLFNHLPWERALLGQREKDDERERIAQGDDPDNDRNGIPDDYDRNVTRPEDDFLHLKYPDTLLRENDYVRYLPRRLGGIPQPVVAGAKGLVRSETVSNTGQTVLVKWNALNPPGRLDAPLVECNAMDLHVLGHVRGGGQLTR